jgi:hypothetical protein
MPTSDDRAGADRRDVPVVPAAGELLSVQGPTSRAVGCAALSQRREVYERLGCEGVPTMSDVPETPRATPGGVPAGAEDRTAAGGAAGADAPSVEVPQLVTNPRVLELWRELNVLAETDADAAAIVQAYRAWNAFMEASKQVASREPSPNTVRERLDEMRRRRVDDERSSTPMFSSKVPEPGAASGAITRELLERIERPARSPVYAINPNAWAHLLEADDRYAKQLVEGDWDTADPTCDCPAEGAGEGEGAGTCPRSELECQVRAYQNGHLTVRQWFRKMRAADFEKALPGRGLVKWVSSIEAQPWTVLDTQKVVNRETAAFYLVPKRDELWFTEGGRILGGITGIYFDGTQ